MSREELKATVDCYWDCLTRDITAEELLVHPECLRIENGMVCTNNVATFRDEFRIVYFNWAAPKEYRFYPIIDETRGVVVSIQRFMLVRQDTESINQYVC